MVLNAKSCPQGCTIDLECFLQGEQGECDILNIHPIPLDHVRIDSSQLTHTDSLRRVQIALHLMAAGL